MSNFRERMRGMVDGIFFKREGKDESKELLSNELEKLIIKLEAAAEHLSDNYKSHAWAEVKKYSAEEIEKMRQPYAQADIGLPNSDKKINSIPNFLSVLNEIDSLIIKRANSDHRYILMTNALEAFKQENAFLSIASIPTALRKLLDEIRALEK